MFFINILLNNNNNTGIMSFIDMIVNRIVELCVNDAVRIIIGEFCICIDHWSSRNASMLYSHYFDRKSPPPHASFS